MSLHTIIETIDAAWKQDEANAHALFSASGSSRGTVATDVRAGRHTFVVDEPESLGGEDEAPNPVEYALAGLIGCQVVVYRFWAAKLGIAVDDIDVKAEGDLDVRGFFGLKDGVRSGFSQVRLDVTLTGPEPERYEELRAAVDAHCPVIDLFANPTDISSTLTSRS
ncbi:MAG: osmotically inducible protein OsmC, partial [Nocardioidaceae bacterium]|nr:osmotically inducible protein OsmC [Nocardioidaceae bacterium]